MPDQILFHAVTREGTPGEVLGSCTLDEGVVSSTPGVAADTIAMLARRFGRTEVEIFALVRDRGWSNGHVMTVRS
ncbi:hypothetical protein [Nonomuraea sp. bgisy101]|uniref:hypothetical protein n=1 Tax=Nonomuraea sp. bgisy101 TaxID=3413784 RepID=UPI003D73469E